MSKSFFALMTTIEKDIKNEGILLTTEFNKFTHFIESGCFTSSLYSKYIARNWRLTSKEIYEKWNTEQNEQKSYHTWRSQTSTLSKQLYAMFPSIELAFISHDRRAINDVLNAVALLSDGDLYANDIFVQEVIEGTDSYSGREYDLNECMDEIRFLSNMRKRYIYENIDMLNKDKLGYLRTILQKPMSSTKYRSANVLKLHVLELMDKVGADSTLFEEQKEKVQEPAKVDNYSKYGFSDMSELVGVMEKVATSENMGNDAEKDAKKLSAIKRLYCADDLKRFLGDVSAETMKEFLRGMKLKTK